MKASLVLGKVLFLTSTLAALDGSARRRSTHGRLGTSSFKNEGENVARGTHSDYSTNWAGAVITAPIGQVIIEASAKFMIPPPIAPMVDGSWGATIWVGIDGYAQPGVVLQGGADIRMDIIGGVVTTSFSAWYEWFPEFSIHFDGFEVSPGDEFSVSVSSSSSTQGLIAIENLTTGRAVSRSLTSTTPLFGKNAEWIVEPITIEHTQIPLANLGTVVFTDCVARTSSSILDLSRSTDIKLTDNRNNVVFNALVLDYTSVEVTYVHNQ